MRRTFDSNESFCKIFMWKLYRTTDVAEHHHHQQQSQQQLEETANFTIIWSAFVSQFVLDLMYGIFFSSLQLYFGFSCVWQFLRKSLSRVASNVMYGFWCSFQFSHVVGVDLQTKSKCNKIIYEDWHTRTHARTHNVKSFFLISHTRKKRRREKKQEKVISKRWAQSSRRFRMN